MSAVAVELTLEQELDAFRIGRGAACLVCCAPTSVERDGRVECRVCGSVLEGVPRIRGRVQLELV